MMSMEPADEFRAAVVHRNRRSGADRGGGLTEGRYAGDNTTDFRVARRLVFGYIRATFGRGPESGPA